MSVVPNRLEFLPQAEMVADQLLSSNLAHIFYAAAQSKDPQDAKLFIASKLLKEETFNPHTAGLFAHMLCRNSEVLSQFLHGTAAQATAEVIVQQLPAHFKEKLLTGSHQSNKALAKQELVADMSRVLVTDPVFTTMNAELKTRHILRNKPTLHHLVDRVHELRQARIN